MSQIKIIQHAKDRAGSLYMKVKNELNRLSNKWRKVKQTKSNSNQKDHANNNDVEKRFTNNAELSRERNQNNINRKRHRRGSKTKCKSKRNCKKRIGEKGN